MAEKKWCHDELANDLAGHLRATGDRVIWTDMQLGPSGSPRPDVYTIGKSYTKFKPISYEIKISVADFRRDITAGKWHSYLKYSCGVIFAVPQGLITKADVPSGCGLIVRTPDGWRNLKGPTLQPLETLPHKAWMKLVIDGIDRQRILFQPRDASEWRAREAIRKKYGEELAQALSDRDSAKSALEYQTKSYNDSFRRSQERHERNLEELRQRQEKEADEIRSIVSELAEALGLSQHTSVRAIRHAAERALSMLRKDDELQRLRESLERAQGALQRVEKNLSDELERVSPLAAGDAA